MKKQSFVFSTLLLAISGIICKVLGAIYKIPLTNILGSQGMGVYYLVFPIYAFLLTLTSSSFTTAISRQVSQLISKGEHLTAFKTFKASLVLLFSLGVGASFLLAALSRAIAILQGLENAFICYLAISPAILLVALSCAFKGYFQGLQVMIPTASAQVVGQITKLSLGFLFAKLFCGNGIVFGAFGALLGLTFSEAVVTLFFVIYYLIFKLKNHNYFTFSNAKINEKLITQKTIIKQLFKTSIPFILSSVILPMSMVIDSFLIVNIFKTMLFNKLFATSLLGLNSGIINTLVSLPSTLSVAICMTVVPFITFNLSQKKYSEVNKKTALAFRLSILVSLPCVFVFILFSPQVLKLLYSTAFSSNYEFNIACSLLMLSSISILYFSFLQISTALLQALNRSYIPVISLSISLIIKVVCEIILINIPSVNIAGAVISNAVSYLISVIINLWYLKTQISLEFSFYKTIVSPIISCLIMSLVIFALTSVFGFSRVGVGISFIVGGISYLVSIMLLKTFSKNELFILKQKNKMV